MNIFQADAGSSSNIFSSDSLIGSLSSDYNFALIPIFFGMIGVFYFLIDPGSLLNKVFYNLVLIIYSLTIFFSGSRRGLFTLVGIIIVLVFIQLSMFIKKDSILKKVGYSTRWYIISISILAVLLSGFIFIIPVQMKRNALNALGINARSYKQVITTRIYKYSTIFSDPEYRRFQDITWNEKPDPRYPDSGWGSRTSTLVFPLTGDNFEIVPESSMGYKLDYTCEAASWDKINAYSYTNISSLFQGDSITTNNEFYFASVYCFVSKDFNGTWARISAEGGASGKVIQEYDLNKKGVWQKLSIWFKNNGNISPVYLYWAKNGVTDFSDLKGSIIFSYPEYKKIKANSFDPESGWGTRTSHSVFPLSGDSIDIVPKGSIGYKMDSTCNATTWNNNAYSFTNITALFQADLITPNRGFYKAFVYCYVSKDFDGNWARISAEGAATGKTIMEYDLRRKGNWQKLQIDFKSDSEIPLVYLYWSKLNATDFSSLKGYIIFAYPGYGTSETIIGFNNRIPESALKEPKSFMSKTLLEKNTDINLYKSGFISFFPVLNAMLSPDIDNDPVRRWVAKIISEDTTYYPPQNLISIDTVSNMMLGPRLMRWEFAWQIYKVEFNIKQKLFGGGFNFLNWYGYYFLNAKKASDYPHNPFLSVLLYSGIFGLLIYLIFFYKVVFYYVKYFKEYPVISIFFVITFFFSFFSAGSPFDPPVMGFFSILPFFIHFIHKKSISESNPEISDKSENAVSE